MKKLVLGALLSTLAFVASIHAQAQQQPYIFHCTESAGPSDVIGLIGDHFGTGSGTQVWMEHVMGTETSLSPTTQLTVVNNNDKSLQALIPNGETLGLYAIWVKNGSYQAGPVFINQARSWGVPDLAGLTVDTGRSFRLFGRNLYFSGQTPTVNFVNGATSIAATVTTTGSDGYGLHITAPSTLVAGTVYSVTVNNGFGGNYGTTTMAHALTAVAAGSDPFGLGVPWGQEFSTIAANVYNVKTDSRLSIHAVGDGVTDDTGAIQNAIYTASGSGGGVVYMPAGTYAIYMPASTGNHVPINMANNVVLKGDGMTSTQLKMTGYDPTQYGFTFQAYACSHVGFYNLCFYNTTTGTGWNAVIDSSSKSFAVGCEFLADAGKNAVFTNDTNAVFRNNTVVSNESDGSTVLGEPTYFLTNTDFVFAGNTITYYFARVRSLNMERVLVENNVATRTGINNGYLAESGGLDFSNDYEAAILNNTFGKGGTDPITMNNDGETILAQGGGYSNRDFGVATGATSTTFSNSGKSWTANEYATYYYVTIVAGTGVGQTRQIASNTATTLTLSQAWTETPDTTSCYVIDEGNIHNLVEGNTLSHEPQGIMYYDMCLDDCTVVNNTLTDNGGIWLNTFGSYQPGDTDLADDRFDTIFDTLIIGNQVTTDSTTVAEVDPARISLTALSQSSNFGTSSYGLEFRNNALTGSKVSAPNGRTSLGEGYAATALDFAPSQPPNDNTTQIVQGTIFSGNSASDVTWCYHLGDGEYNTAIWNANDSNYTNLMDDENGYGSHASVDTVFNTQFGLVGYWKLDEDSGSTSADSSPSGIDGTWENDPVFSDQVASAIQFPDAGCLTFDGVNQYVNMGTPTQLPTGHQARTISGWGKANSTAGGYRWIAAFGTPNTDEAMFIGMNGTSLVGGGYNGDDVVVPNFWDTNWHFIALTYDGTTAKLYADGVLVGSAAKDWDLVAGQCLIGEQVNNAGEYWNGSIDDVRIFNRELSPAEILNLSAGNP